MLQNAVSLCPGSSRVIPLLSPQLLRRESRLTGLALTGMALIILGLVISEGRLPLRRKKA